MKNIVKIFCIVLAVSFVVAAAASCGTTTDKGYTSKNDKFVIGLSGPLTGPASQYGIAVENAAKMAVEEINAAGGIFGYEFSLISFDDQHDSSRVSTGYASMIESGMQVSLGCVTSLPCAEFKSLSKEDNVFFITPSASNDEIPSESNGYQMCFADGNQGKAAALYVNNNFKGQTIGVLYTSGDNYSEGIYNQFKSNVDSSVTVVAASFVEGATDFSSQINTLKDCEFVFMPIYYTPASQFMIQAKNVQNSMKVFYGCDGLDGIDTISGFDINSIPQEISYLSHFNSASTEGKSGEFVAKYTEKFGTVPSQFAAAAYDCVYAIFEAMKAVGKDKISVTMSASDLCDLLTAQFDGGFTFSGATGSDMKWTRSTSGYGYVEKAATKYVVKAGA